MVFDSAARRPVVEKLDFCFSGGGVVLQTVVPVKASFWDGKGALERLRGDGLRFRRDGGDSGVALRRRRLEASGRSLR